MATVPGDARLGEAPATPVGQMLVRWLEIEDLRVLERVRLEPAPGLNVLYGPNGSGKTSVLEGVHLLALGRSFRSRHLRDARRRGSDAVRVRGGIVAPDGRTQTLAIEHGEQGLRIRAGGEDVRSASGLARLLPLVLITPDGQRLLTDGADLRRRVVDWSLFHVEPSYQQVHQRYRRVLRQRNSCLRAQGTEAELDAWTREVAAEGEVLHRLRLERLTAVLERFDAYVERLLGQPVDIRYLPGWRVDEPLETALRRGIPVDRARGYTEAGPHRADLRFTVSGAPARTVLSRGEGKLFVLALLLAQAEHLVSSTVHRPVVLVDELASELDDSSRERAFSAMRALGLQTFVTSVSRTLVETGGWKPDGVFHVERGRVGKVV